MPGALVDASGWLALLMADHDRHPEVRQVLADLTRAGTALATTNYILDEAATDLRRHCGLVVSLRFLVSLEQAQAVHRLRLLWVDQRAHEEAWRLLQQYRELPLSFTDATTAAVARANRIEQIVGTDPNFAEIGFRVAPGASSPDIGLRPSAP
jgi:predicted nucleic acid-binding protein